MKSEGELLEIYVMMEISKRHQGPERYIQREGVLKDVRENHSTKAV
jgi:hypothetical protein